MTNNEIKSIKTRATDLMTNTQLGYFIEYNDTQYQVTIDYQGDDLLLGTASLTLYLNRKKFGMITLSNLIFTWKREINDLISKDPILFSRAIDSLDLLIDSNSIEDNRIDQRLLLMVYLLGNVRSFIGQSSISKQDIEILDVFTAVDRLKANLIRAKYSFQVYIKVLIQHLDTLRDSYLPSSNNQDQVVDQENTQDHTSTANQWKKSEIENLLGVSIVKDGKQWVITGDSLKYNNLQSIADQYQLTK